MTSRLPQISAELRLRCDEVEREIGEELAARARDRAPVGETGNLQSSISARGRYKRPVTTAFYSRFVEYGTVNMEEQPYLRPSADELEDDFVSAVKTVLRTL